MKKTYADVASEITAKQKKYQGIIDSQDTTNLEKKTAQMNLQQLNAFADEVFNAMEEDKRGSVAVPQKFARGGQVDPRLLAWLPGQPVTAPMIQGSVDAPQDFSVSGRGDLSGLYASGPQITPTLPYAPDRSIQPLESTSSAQFQSMNNSIQDPGGFDPSSVVGYIIPGMNMARGIFGKAKELDPNDYRITKKIAPTRMDVTPQLEGVDSQAAITRRNIRSGSPTQIMSGNIATSDWATRAKAGIYSNKWNADQQSRQQSQLLDLENERNNIQMELQIGDMNDRAKAAKENLTSTGMSQMLESYYRDRNDAIIQRQLEMDEQQFNKGLEAQRQISQDALKGQREMFDFQTGAQKSQQQHEWDMWNAEKQWIQNYPQSVGGVSGGGVPTESTQEPNSYVATDLAQMALGYRGIPADATEYEKGIISELQKNKVAMTDWAMDYILPREGGSTDPKSKSAISQSGAVGPAQLQPMAAVSAGLKIPDSILKLDKERDKAASKGQWAKANELGRQLVEETKRQWAAGWKDPRLDEKQNKEAARSILWSNYKHFNNDMRKAIAAYHQGVGTIDGLVAKYGDQWDQHVGPIGKKYIADIPAKEQPKAYADDLERLGDNSMNLLYGAGAAAGLYFPLRYGTKFGRNQMANMTGNLTKQFKKVGNFIYGSSTPKATAAQPEMSSGVAPAAKSTPVIERSPYEIARENTIKQADSKPISSAQRAQTGLDYKGRPKVDALGRTIKGGQFFMSNIIGPIVQLVGDVARDRDAMQELKKAYPGYSEQEIRDAAQKAQKYNMPIEKYLQGS